MGESLSDSPEEMLQECKREGPVYDSGDGKIYNQVHILAGTASHKEQKSPLMISVVFTYEKRQEIGLQNLLLTIPTWKSCFTKLPGTECLSPGPLP